MERKWCLFVLRNTSGSACVDGSVLCQNHYVSTNLTVYILFFVQTLLTSVYIYKELADFIITAESSPIR